MKWSFFASNIVGSVCFTTLILSDLPARRWWQVIAVVINTLVWQAASVYAWDYWTAIETRDRERERQQ